MKTLRNAIPWQRALLALCVILGGVTLAGCKQPAPTATPRPTGKPTIAPTLGPSALPATTTTAADLPPEPGTLVPLDTGGSVFIPEGALPPGATIASAATRMPLLPEGVEAVGDALSITASSDLLRPVTLRLPIPAGVTDPEKLVVLDVSADGAVLFLMTRVENNELVAETPGFSTIARGRVQSGLPLSLGGKTRLMTGEEHTYLVQGIESSARVVATWSALGRSTVVRQGDRAATLRAANEPGMVDLICTCSEQPSGRRWYGTKSIRVLHSGQSPDSYTVSVVAVPPEVLIGQDQVRIWAAVHGNYQAPITWNWEFDNGARGGPITTAAGATELELPFSSYPPQDQPGVRGLSVWARDAQDRLVAGIGQYVLEVDPIKLVIDGPSRLRWTGPPGVYDAYTARASGGEPPYAYSFQLVPGEDKTREGGGANSDTVTLRFDQPGEFLLRVTAEDKNKRITQTALSILVTGADKFSTAILSLPETAQPGEKVSAVISVRGGVLLSGGRKGGYQLRVNWGDGSSTSVVRDVGATTMPYTGTIISLSHTFAVEGKRTVRLEAFDTTGRMDWYEKEITITGAGTPTRAATATKAAAAATPTGGLLVWVRQEPAVVNVNKDPLESVSTEPRWAGSFSKVIPGETNFTTQERYVEYDVEYYNVSVTCSFERPPLVLNPGLRYKVSVSCGSGGAMNSGGEGMGERFWYSTSRGYENIVEPREVLNYFPWSTGPKGPTTKEWMITAPPAKKVGDTFQLYASLWNRPPCNVTWTYRAEYH